MKEKISLYDCEYDDEAPATIDDDGMRNGFGEETFSSPERLEEYSGNFLNNAYHGFGCYRSLFSNKWTYEGSFYCNEKNGYGALSLPNNSFFQGLFKGDRPFGPGVYTRSDGSQDVGYWYCNSIVRLLFPVVSNIKALSTTPSSKVKMLMFRKLIELNPEEDVALKIMRESDLNEQDASKLYSCYSKNPNSSFFDHELFERNYFEDLVKISPQRQDSEAMKSCDDGSRDTRMSLILEKMTEERLESQCASNPSALVKPKRKSRGHSSRRSSILVKNNSPLMIDIILHTFRNRLFENIVDFSIERFLFNERRAFGEIGRREQAAADLLAASDDGDLKAFIKIVKCYKVNLDVQDSLGNGCLIRAAAKDHHELIELIYTLGGNMNMVNDDGFSAISYVLTKYLAQYLDSDNWSETFIRPNDSHPGHKYAFNVRPAHKVKPDPKSGNPDKKQEEASTSLDEKVKQAVRETVKRLCAFGGDINLSTTPQPSIILAIFTEDLNLLQVLLEHGANPNCRTHAEEGLLTPLHMICLAKPKACFPRMAKMLLRYGANPNSRAAVDYDMPTKQYIMQGKKIECFADEGMRPLEALLLRTDANYVEKHKILREILGVLYRPTDKTVRYFGHTLLSLAIIRKNIDFVSALSSTYFQSPNEKLEPYWGNIPTAFLSYLHTTTEPEIDMMLIVLEQAGINPLRLETTLCPGGESNTIDYGVDVLNIPTRRVIQMKGKRKKTRGKSIAENYGPPKAFLLLQDICRKKVDAFAKGEMVRRFTKAKRRKMPSKDLNFLSNLTLSWFKDEHEFLDVLKRNVRAGHVTLCQDDVDDILELLGPILQNESAAEVSAEHTGENYDLVHVQWKKMHLNHQLEELVHWCEEQTAKLKSFHRHDKIVHGFPTNLDLHPEVNTDPNLFKVCYKCLRRNTPLTQCSVCKVAWTCLYDCTSDAETDEKFLHNCAKVFNFYQGSWREGRDSQNTYTSAGNKDSVVSINFTEEPQKKKKTKGRSIDTTKGSPVAGKERSMVVKGSSMATKGSSVATKGSSLSAKDQPGAGKGDPAPGKGRPMYGRGRPMYGKGRPVYGKGRPMYGKGDPMAGMDDSATEKAYQDPHEDHGEWLDPAMEDGSFILDKGHSFIDAMKAKYYSQHPIAPKRYQGRQGGKGGRSYKSPRPNTRNMAEGPPRPGSKGTKVPQQSRHEMFARENSIRLIDQMRWGYVEPEKPPKNDEPPSNEVVDARQTPWQEECQRRILNNLLNRLDKNFNINKIAWIVVRDGELYCKFKDSSKLTKN